MVGNFGQLKLAFYGWARDADAAAAVAHGRGAGTRQLDAGGLCCGEGLAAMSAVDDRTVGLIGLGAMGQGVAANLIIHARSPVQRFRLVMDARRPRAEDGERSVRQRHVGR